MDLPVTLAGLGILQVAAICLMAILGAAMLGHMALRRSVNLTSLDIIILLYAIWCTVGWLAYPDKTHLTDLVRWILPLIGFVILKNLIVSKRHYQTALFAMLCGYFVPVIGSSVLISLGKSLEQLNYWTKLSRYEGVFANSHNMAHSMAFYIMALVLFLHLRFYDNLEKGKRVDNVWVLPLVMLSPAVLFCLYMSYVRTAFLGLVLFFVIYLFQVNRVLLFWALLVGGVSLVAIMPLLKLVFFDVVEVIEGEKGLERLGSGRPFFWKHNIQEFLGLPMDRKLLGGGIGNDIAMNTYRAGDSFWDSHNDYLDVLIETGIVGFCLFFLIQIMFWIRIFRLDFAVRAPFVALMGSVTFMNFASNSYISRFHVAQLLYLVLAYVKFRSFGGGRVGSESGKGERSD